MGTSPLYYLAVAFYRLPAHPVLIGSVALLWGYLRSWLKGLPRYDDLDSALPPLLPARLPAHGQAGRHCQGRRRAGASLACQPPHPRS